MVERTSGFGNIPQKTDNRKNMKDAVELLQLPPDGTWTTVRIMGDVFMEAKWWVPIVSQHGKELNIPKTALSYDFATGEVDSSIEDPYRDLIGGKPQVSYYVNVILRDEQEQEPKRNKISSKEKKTGFKDKSNKGSWTPVFTLRITAGVAGKLQALKALNKHKGKSGIKAYEVSDSKFGCDIHIAFDKNKAAAEMYQVQKGDSSSLTKEEKAYLIWNIEEGIEEQDPLEVATKEAASLAQKMVNEEVDDDDDDDDDDDFDDDEPVKKKKKSSGLKSKSKSKDEKKKIKKKPKSDSVKKSKTKTKKKSSKEDEKVSKKKVVKKKKTSKK